MRTIKVCSGIGDNVWLLQKLINSGEQFNFELPDSPPKRGVQVFELLPQVAASATYISGLSYKILSRETAKGLWSSTPRYMYLSCNEWLESGQMLKDWMPDLSISYKLPWDLGPVESKGKYIGIYGSTYSTQRSWQQYGAWGITEWLQLIKLIHKHNRDYTFVIIGAVWDNDFATEITAYLTVNKIHFINTIGEPLIKFMQWTRLLKYAFYFPSGLPILSETIEGCSDCTMFYTTNIKKIMGTWCDPERRQNGKFKECIFCQPTAIFEWCVNNGKL